MSEPIPATTPPPSRIRAAAFPRSFRFLIAGTFAHLVGYECGYPFESIFLNERVSVSMTAVGLIHGLTQLGGLPMQVVGGAVADRFGRRVGICATIVLFEGLAFARSVWPVVALIAVEAAFGWAGSARGGSPPLRRARAAGIRGGAPRRSRRRSRRGRGPRRSARKRCRPWCWGR